MCPLFLDSIHDSGQKAGLYKENLLLRGCTIRNTEAIVGIVIYAGRCGWVSCGLTMLVHHVMWCVLEHCPYFVVF